MSSVDEHQDEDYRSEEHAEEEDFVPEPEPRVLLQQGQQRIIVPPPRKRGRPPNKRRAGAAAAAAAAASQSASPGLPDGVVKRGPGRPRRHPLPPLEDEILELIIENDEVVLPGDPDGDRKVDALGNLQGGRQYKVRTFTLVHKGDRKYMLSTEPARCVGFRDLYLLFHKHRYLYKYIALAEEKADLIARNLLPATYKGRSISLVTARLVFREFGARVVVGGRRITDDYYEQRERDSGAVEGELADLIIPDALQFGAVLIPGVELDFSKYGPRTRLNNDETWRLRHAEGAKELNHKMAQVRLLAYAPAGIRDPYTNVTFVPQNTQPTRAVVTKVGADLSLLFAVGLHRANWVRRTGLGSVPREVYADVVDPEVLRAIERQVSLEQAQ